MSEEEKDIQPQQKSEEQEIDLIELAKKVWADRKLVLKWCGIAIIVGLVIAFSIPREYSTSVTLAPETTTKNANSGMGALAAMAGINVGNSGSEDALSPELYPDIVNSTPFLIGLFNIHVEDGEKEVNTTLYDYMENHQRSPWWSVVLSAPGKAIGWVLSLFKDQPDEDGTVVNPFQLTRDQNMIEQMLGERISVSIDKKTGVTTLAVTMQDPLISATLTDSVMIRLQNYITDYRTNKSRHDLAFTEKLYEEAKSEYYIAQQKYAEFVDGNKNVIRQSSRVDQERLQNEVTLTYGVYSQVAQQLQMARAKVQEKTPVYTVVQPATVSLRPAKPNKIMILIGFVFLAGVASVGWILFIKDFIGSWKKKEE